MFKNWVKHRTDAAMYRIRSYYPEVWEQYKNNPSKWYK